MKTDSQSETNPALAGDAGSEISINVRAAQPPYDTYPATGHLPFEMHGERFAITIIPNPLNDFQKWRVTHIDTGAAIPGVFEATIELARERGMAHLTEVGPEKLKAALARVRALFPNVRHEPRP